MDLRGEVAVVEIEPVGTAVARLALLRMKSFTTDSPALCRIDDRRQGVGHNVEVGRNFQAVELDVIAGVHDDAQRRRFHGLVKAEKQFRGADAACESGDFSFFDWRHEMAAKNTKENLTQRSQRTQRPERKER